MDIDGAFRMARPHAPVSLGVVRCGTATMIGCTSCGCDCRCMLLNMASVSAHHMLNTGAVIPASVEDDDFTSGGQLFNVALGRELRLLPLSRRGEGDHAMLNGYSFRGSIAGAAIQELVGRGNRLQGGSLAEIVNVPSGSLLCQADSGPRESQALGVAVTVAVRC